MTTTINRDAGEQVKGFRLQKLRAVKLTLDAIEKSESANIYSAIEQAADVYLVKADKIGTQQYHEEDKNYDPLGSFTYNSPAVLNTIVIFIDCWIGKYLSKNCIFGFYTTRAPGQERETERTKTLALTLPSRPILELLQAHDFSDMNLIECCSKLAILEYEKQYTQHGQTGYLTTIKEWAQGDWINFFKQINWKFGEEDEIALEATLIESIKKSKLYVAELLNNKEKTILSCLVDEFDRRQSLKDKLERFVYSSDVKLVFKQVSSGNIPIEDPAWQIWNTLQPTDQRDLSSKMKSVCDIIDQKQYESWSRKISLSLLEQQNLAHDKSILSLKYQIYDCCRDELNKLIAQNNGRKLTGEQLDIWMAALLECGVKRISDVSQDYRYLVGRSEAFVKGIILSLFNECFLAFDNTSKA